MLFGSFEWIECDHLDLSFVAGRHLSLSQTSSGWRVTENRAMLSCDEGSFQIHWLDDCRSISVAGSGRGRDLDIAALKVRHWLTIYETAIRTGQASTGNSYSSSHTNETHELNCPIRPDGRAMQLGDGEA